jgi:hypothetical protein
MPFRRYAKLAEQYNLDKFAEKSDKNGKVY